jgi:hypothetical protein
MLTAGVAFGNPHVAYRPQVQAMCAADLEVVRVVLHESKAKAMFLTQAIQHAMQLTALD